MTKRTYALSKHQDGFDILFFEDTVLRKITKHPTKSTGRAFGLASVMQTYSIVRIDTKAQRTILKGVFFECSELEDIIEKYPEEFL